MKRNGGFTLLEIMVSITILLVLFALSGVAVRNMMQVSAREQAVLEMDQDANRILESIKQTLRGAYIPVAEAPLNSGRKVQLASTDLEKNAGRWRDVLTNGSDMVAFLVGIDTEGDGDILYGDSKDNKRVAFGVYLTEDSNVFLEATDENDTLANLGIVDLNLLVDLGLKDDNVGDIETTISRFADSFVFPTPGSRQPVYGVIRFLPYRERGTETVINEAALEYDLNHDGDTTDSFVLGRLEIVYPDGSGGTLAKPISGNTVLLQINRNDAPQYSIFQLEDSRSSEGSAVKINLLLCNFSTQDNNKSAFVRGRPSFLARSYESRLKTQIMSRR